MCSSPGAARGGWKASKLVWVWTRSKQVMTAAVERGWDTFLFASDAAGLADDWRSIALIQPLFIRGSEIVNEESKKVALLYTVASPKQLTELQPNELDADNVVISLQDNWQIIPAENIVAMFHGGLKTVFAVASTSDEAQTFLEALEEGLGGVVLKVEDANDILKLKDYFNKKSESLDVLPLTLATITKVQIVGMGDRVCVDLCSLMHPGEGLLVGSFARGLFLVHSECFNSNYIASRPFRVNAGPVHAYVAVPGGKTSYLSELKAGDEVLIVNERGFQRSAIVGRTKIESRQLVLVEAKENLETKSSYSIFLQNAETVGLVCACGEENKKSMIPVTSLKAGDRVMLRIQGGARHTGIEIKEFILEK